MMEYVGGFFKGLADSIGLIFFAFVGGLIRTIYRPSARSLRAYFLSILISVPLGVLAGMIGKDIGLSPATGMALAVVVGIISHDLIEAVFWAVDRVRANQDSIWAIIWRRFTRRIGGDDGKV